MSSRVQFTLIYSGILVIGVLLILFLYPQIHFFGGMHFQISEEEAAVFAHTFLSDVGHSLEAYHHEVRYERNRTITALAEDRWGIRRANAAYREGFPGYVRSFRWYTEPRPTLLGVLLPTERPAAPGEPRLRIDGRGRIHEFSIDIPDTAFYPSLDEEEARHFADSIVQNFSRFASQPLEIEQVLQSQKPNRTDWIVMYAGDDSFLRYPVTVELNIAGNILSHYRERYELAAHLTPDRNEVLLQMQFLFVYTILMIVLLFLAVKRLRAGELGFRTAIPIGILAGAFYGFQFLILSFSESTHVFVLFIFLLNAVLFAVAVMISWATGESIGRTTWREKFISFDLLTNGQIFHSHIGTTILRGIVFGTIIFVGYSIFYTLIDTISPLRTTVAAEILNYLNSSIASAFVITNSVSTMLLFGAFIFVPFTSLTRQRTGSTALVIGIPAALLAMAQSAFFQPISSGFLILFIYGIALVWILYRFDVLTLLIATGVCEMYEWGTLLLTIGDPFLLQHGFVVFGGLTLLWGIGVAALHTKDLEFQEEDIAPSFQRFISERERLQREFEIAREVQMGFLPSYTPVVPTLEIAARCIPAKEIGGDYYDFIQLNEEQLGIVIGDVSGKGTKAAFYMTLVKGFVHAAARPSVSPSTVLQQVNRLFFNHTGSGAFISMVYCLYDGKNSTFTLARAGHNPIVYYNSVRNSVESIRPQGIAIGLHEGSLFPDTISDISLHVNPGDIVILYTDGITEAMNRDREEFGSSRLLDTVHELRGNGAQEILDAMFERIDSFIQRNDQSDDMTMVVMKVR